MIPAAPLTGIAASLNKPAHSEEIERALQARVSAREIPGAVAMAANEQSVVYEGAFGFRDMAAASRMSTDTVFRIASMVKLLTSVAALHLAPKTTSWTTVPTFTSWTLKANSCAPLTPTRQAIASPMHCANSWRNLAKEEGMGCYEPNDEIASCNTWSLRGLLDTVRLPEAGS
jgi:hypothetical protein